MRGPTLTITFAKSRSLPLVLPPSYLLPSRPIHLCCSVHRAWGFGEGRLGDGPQWAWAGPLHSQRRSQVAWLLQRHDTGIVRIRYPAIVWNTDLLLTTGSVVRIL